tara:strand:- start:875 stop:1948 length:1074 start_codon:yes stop_codon:yes gene_type:complete
MAMTATVLDNIKVNYPNLLDQFDNRKADHGLLRKAIMNSNMAGGIISADLKEKAQNSYGRTIDIPTISQTPGTLGSALACTATDTVSVSAFVNVTWVTVSASWFMEPAKNDQNEISYLQEFASQYSAQINAIYNSMDSSIDTALIAALCVEAQYGNTMIGAGNKYGALLANRIDVSLAQRELFLNDMTSINKSDDIYGRQDLIGSTNAESILRNTYAQGQANDTNTGFQAGLFDAMFTNNVTVGAASDATCYVVPKGSFGLVTRNSPDCRAGRSTTDGKMYGMTYDPVLGANIDTLYSSSCQDINAKTGNALDVAAVQEQHQIAVNFGILTPSSAFAAGPPIIGAPGVIRAFNFQTA